MELEQLHVRLTRRDLDGPSTVLVVEGEADVHAAPRLRAELDAIREVANSIVVDLSGASFIDSSILGLLLIARKELDAAGGRLVVVCPQSHVLRAFSHSALDRVFTIVGTLADAIAELRLESHAPPAAAA